MNEDEFTKCVTDEKQMTALNDRAQRNAKEHEVDATPTFEINGKKMEPGYHTLDQIDAAIAAASSD